ncbi:MAG TPA: hypothetical protein VGP19_07710 [Candidatus Acidoferrales bacterium]|nr:hypothetical protein [Candidatus Acidoferrales bacterium]
MKRSPKRATRGYYDVCMLSSVAADLPVTQVVDGNKGVHMTIAKPIFTKAR